MRKVEICGVNTAKLPLLNNEEMRALFPYAQEALDNTVKIAERCQVEIEFGVTKLPKYDVPGGYTSWEYLNKLCFEGLEALYPAVTEALKERLDYELNTIKEMGYVDYFLIVWDFINYAKRTGSWWGLEEVLRRGVSSPMRSISPTLIPSNTICSLSVSSIRSGCPCRILILTSALNGVRRSLIMW